MSIAVSISRISRVEQVRVINKEFPRQVAGEVQNWGDQVGAMTFLLMRQDHWDTHYRPGGWGCRIALTHALIFHCSYQGALVSPDIP